MVLAHPSFLNLEFLKNNAESHLIKLVSIKLLLSFRWYRYPTGKHVALDSGNDHIF